MKEFFKKYRFIIFIILIFLGCLLFAHFNTFLANDDLPYSFYLRGENRIKTLGQILSNQLADYKHLNGRFFVHCTLQFVLIFGKKLWSFINPIMIILTLIMIFGISKRFNKKINKELSLVLGIILYLLMYNYRQIMYWVAGSINYIWVFAFLSIFLYLYYKYGFCKIKIINTLIIAILCAIHECTMVFTIIFVLSNMGYDWFKNKKLNKNYFIYILGFAGSLVLLLSPANNLRMVSDEVWNSLTFFEKIFTSIPVVSKNLFYLKDINNILPYIFIISVIYNLKFKENDNIANTLVFLNLIISAISFVSNNGWIYFTLTILLVISEYYSNYKKNRAELTCLSLSFYAVIFSNILTPLYAAGRPNYYFYIYIILYAMISFNNLLKNKKLILLSAIVLVLLCSGLLIKEVIVYNYIGNVYQSRIESIKEYKENDCKGILYLKKIDEKYKIYHIDANLPTKEWFTYRYYLQYNDLPLDTEIVYE